MNFMKIATIVSLLSLGALLAPSAEAQTVLNEANAAGDWVSDHAGVYVKLAK